MSAPPRWSPTPAIFYAVVVQAFVPAREQQLHRRNRSGESEEDEGDALFSVEDIAADADLEVHDESEAFQVSGRQLWSVWSARRADASATAQSRDWRRVLRL